MQINVRFLENLRIEASFDDFKVVSDQPVRYKGDGSAPGPFDYFLASSAMCAAYFVKVYCKSRGIPTDDIEILQDNIVDPENRYNQLFNIQVKIPDGLSEKDKEGIVRSIERCTVKKVIQEGPEFKITPIATLKSEKGVNFFGVSYEEDQKTFLPGKDSSLEETLSQMSLYIENLGIKLEIGSWRNIIPHVWSVHVRDADCPMNYTNGKGTTKESALCSALGEYLERLSSNYFYSDYFLGTEISEGDFVHYPNEKWFQVKNDLSLPEEILDKTLLNLYNPNGELKANHLIDTNSGNKKRGICAVPYIRQSDGEEVLIPVNIIGNLFVSNGMSAGNTLYEARVQCLSEIFERAIKNKIITEEISLPDVPLEILKSYPSIYEGILSLEERGFPIYIKDASLGGKYPVMCVTLMNPKTGGVFASFGSHPRFEVALERSLTELLQGRSFEGLNDMPAPTFNGYSICEQNNIIDHFIDSTGIISWKFFSNKNDFDFVHWNFSGNTKEEFSYLMNILKDEGKEVYIADYKELGANACRILVPGYSEIYLAEDLIWDNNNKGIHFRSKILSLHSLSDEELIHLLEELNQYDLDDYMPVSELIGIAFDENSVWGQLSIAELKCLISLVLKDYEGARELIELLFTFNDNSSERRKFFQLLGASLDVVIDEELELENYLLAFSKMFGKDLVRTVIDSIEGKIRFYGLTQTSMKLEGLDKHQGLIKSYQKIQKAKRDFHKGRFVN